MTHVDRPARAAQHLCAPTITQQALLVRPMAATKGEEMLKTLIGLLPFAIGLAIFAALQSYLLGRDLAFGRWLLAAFLVAHGLIHVLFLLPQPAPSAATAGDVEYPFDMARSWLVTGGMLDLGVVRLLGLVLIAVVVSGFVMAGLATVGALVPSSWWPGLMIGSAAASIVLLAVCISPSLALGFAIDAILIWLVVASAWVPVASVAYR